LAAVRLTAVHVTKLLFIPMIRKIRRYLFSKPGLSGRFVQSVHVCKVTVRSVALGYWLDDRRLKSRQGLGILLFITASRLALGVHSASYSMGIRGSFSESKAVGAWSWPLTSI